MAFGVSGSDNLEGLHESICRRNKGSVDDLL